MFGAIAKNYWAEKLKIKREDMVVVSIMPCVAKKYECQRDEFKVDGNPDVDFSLTTRELAELIKQFNIDFNSLDEGIKAFIDNLEINFISKGLTTPEQINPRYAEDQNWSRN